MVTDARGDATPLTKRSRVSRPTGVEATQMFFPASYELHPVTGVEPVRMGFAPEAAVQRTAVVLRPPSASVKSSGEESW